MKTLKNCRRSPRHIFHHLKFFCWWLQTGFYNTWNTSISLIAKWKSLIIEDCPASELLSSPPSISFSDGAGAFANALRSSFLLLKIESWGLIKLVLSTYFPVSLFFAQVNEYQLDTDDADVLLRLDWLYGHELLGPIFIRHFIVHII